MSKALALKQEPETRRMHEAVRQYWMSVKENRLFPAVEEIEPGCIAGAWNHCFIVDMRKGHVSDGFRYTYMGHDLMGAYGMDMSSLGRCDNATAPHVGSMLRHFDEVAESGEPAMDESEFINTHGDRIKYRCCLLPLGRGDKVQYILGCMRWKTS
ncbi:MAG: PAS domain-containing protein [Alphaproteobacteria bacterium]|nr:PAS domain-containing protein [Alphaproteobacteria bacterium]